MDKQNEEKSETQRKENLGLLHFDRYILTVLYYSLG